MNLPLCVEEITPEWLSAALSAWTPGTRVAAIETLAVLRGSATKVRIVAHYASRSEGGPPTALCIKGGFSEEIRKLTGSACQLEARFFAQVARALPIRLPRCWYAAVDSERNQGIVILEDLVEAGAHFGDPLHPWSADQVAAALEVQASWHGHTWATTTLRYPSLPVGSPVRVLAKWLLGADNWRRTLCEPHAARLPAPLRDRGRVGRATVAMWAQQDQSSLRCLSHADPHLGNTYLDWQGRPGFLDWQTACLAPPIDDVAYFIGGSLTVEDRRAHERTLLQHYLEVLAANRGVRLSFDDVWREFRRDQMHGFLWVLTPAAMQSPERVAAMSERHATAIIDHETLQLLDMRASTS